jgi:ribonuclease E
MARASEPEEKPKRRTRKTKATESEPVNAAESPESAPPPSADNDSAAEQDGEPRRGWWQRTFG